MRIDLHPRLRRRVRKLTAADRDQISECLRALGDGFGSPHLHSGLGIRRLRRDLFECRAELHWREMRAFLDHLVRERHVSRATLGVYVAALQFLYRVTLDRSEVVQRIRYPRRVTERLPDILSPGEVEQLLGTLRALKHRAMVMFAYRARLRVSELCALTGAAESWH